jgi:hypothetical protein
MTVSLKDNQSTSSDFYLAATRIALELPGPARTETRRCGEGVLHELHVRHLPVMHLAKDGEWSRDRLAELCRRVGEPAKDGHVLVLPDNCFRAKEVDVPVLGNIVKRLADCIYAAAGPAPRHNLVQVRVAVVQRDVRDILHAEASHGFWVSNVVQESLNGLFRFHSFSLGIMCGRENVTGALQAAGHAAWRRSAEMQSRAHSRTAGGIETEDLAERRLKYER